MSSRYHVCTVGFGLGVIDTRLPYYDERFLDVNRFKLVIRSYQSVQLADCFPGTITVLGQEHIFVVMGPWIQETFAFRRV